jgi:hypothetical protein
MSAILDIASKIRLMAIILDLQYRATTRRTDAHGLSRRGVFQGSHQTSNNAGARIALNGRPIRLPCLEASKRGAWSLRGQWFEQVAHNS